MNLSGTNRLTPVRDLKLVSRVCSVVTLRQKTMPLLWLFSCWYVLLLHLEYTLLFVPILVLSLIASSCLPTIQVLRSKVSIGQWVSLPTRWESRPINLKSKFIRCRPTLGLGTSDWHFQLIMTKCTDMTHSFQNCAHSSLKVCIIWQADITELSCWLVSVQP